MLQGIELYNILDPGTLSHIEHFTLGQGSKANCVEAINNHAYFTSSNGLFVVNISNLTTILTCPSKPAANLQEFFAFHELLLQILLINTLIFFRSAELFPLDFALCRCIELHFQVFTAQLTD